MEPLKAPALRPGDTVAIVAPAGPPDHTSLNRGVRFLENSGFRVIIANHVIDRNGYLAGTDADRTNDFNSMLKRQDVRAIFCARGGYGSARIVRDLDFAALRKDPKIIVGFSDITTILAAVWAECRLITFHGPLATSLGRSPWTDTHLLTQISGQSGATHPWPQTADPSNPGRMQTFNMSQPVEGRLFGGCLSLLVTLTGTPWDLQDQSPILFFEEISEAPYRIDRMLTHLRNAQWFSKARGLLSGQFINCIQRPDDPEPTPATNDIVRSILTSQSLPVITNLPFGHGPSALTIPFGALVQIDHSGVRQIESVVATL
ncbi:LD-carboxypeptidase [bacterium]|nr:LD-carboxypeptidase [candidate division CSSED10-310 bacterium]